MSEPLIVKVIRRYHPDWEPPPDNGKDWVKCLCPFHAEERPSAAVSYDRQGFNCFACGVRGDVISIIRHEEGVAFAEAKRIAESLGVEGDTRMGSSVRSIKRRPRKSSIANRPRIWS